MNNPLRVLIVHSSPHHAEDLHPILADAGFETRIVTDSVSAFGALEVWRPQAALVDLRFSSSVARQFCQDLSLRREQDQIPLVLIAEGPNLLKKCAVVPAGLVSAPIDADRLVSTVVRVTEATTTQAQAHVSGRLTS